MEGKWQSGWVCDLSRDCVWPLAVCRFLPTYKPTVFQQFLLNKMWQYFTQRATVLTHNCLTWSYFTVLWGFIAERERETDWTEREYIDWANIWKSIQFCFSYLRVCFSPSGPFTHLNLTEKWMGKLMLLLALLHVHFWFYWTEVSWFSFFYFFYVYYYCYYILL